MSTPSVTADTTATSSTSTTTPHRGGRVATVDSTDTRQQQKSSLSSSSRKATTSKQLSERQSSLPTSNETTKTEISNNDGILLWDFGSEQEISAIQQSQQLDWSNLTDIPEKSTTKSSTAATSKSSYAKIAATCRQILHLYVNTTSSSSSSSTTRRIKSTHILTDVRRVGNALIQCFVHPDRRCRIVTIQTLCILGRTCYGLSYQPALLTTQRSISPIMDEIASDWATAFLSVVLDDVDDGVAAAALASLGRMILPTGQHDDLTMALYQWHSPSPYTPSLYSISYDPSILLEQLFVRVMDNVVGPRLLPLIERTVRWNDPYQMASTIPILTAAILHQWQVHAGTETDRPTYSKRWTELDAVGILDIVVTEVLQPSMHTNTIGHLSLSAAMASLRIAAILPKYLPSLSIWMLTVLQEEASACRNTESRAALLAAVLVTLRGLSCTTIINNTRVWVVDQILALPSTVYVPTPTNGALVIVQKERIFMYRRPARIALWTELALSFFVDGPKSVSRTDSLRVLLSCTTIVQLLAVENSIRAVLSPRDELLLAFTKAAIQSGRTFRVHDTLAADEWIQLAGIVLHVFLPCVTIPIPGASYLDETMSLLSAGLASYVQLLQEYLHLCGRLHPTTSVALQLGRNACPPHIWWDRLAESATFLASRGEMEIRTDTTTTTTTTSTSNNNAGSNNGTSVATKLFEELMSCEVKIGIPSHHVRQYVVALAADYWVQCQIATIREHIVMTTASTHRGNTTVSSPPALDLASVRNCLRALAPKRMLAKISQSHIPPVDQDGKAKRDPIKKLALESVRLYVACIENIALLACEWRHRFGSSSESKQIMSVTIGLLQGKIDDTPMNDLMKIVLGPTCESAVDRIHTVYETSSKESDTTFPVSELVFMPSKIKIKPLVSSSKLSPRPRDNVMREYMMQLCRQMVDSRVQLAMQHTLPVTDTLLTSGRPIHSLRLSVPPICESKDGRLYDYPSNVTASGWGQCGKVCSTPSDPAQVVVAYLQHRFLRYDGEKDYHVTVFVRVHNMLPIDLSEGIRLGLSIVQDTPDDNDTITSKYAESLGGTLNEMTTELPLLSAEAVYNQELKSDDHVMWEFPLSEIKSSNSLRIVPSVVYRSVKVEPYEAGATFVGQHTESEKVATAGIESQNGEDDFQVTSSDATNQPFRGEQEEIHNVRFTGESITLPPLIFVQPCPLVFYRDRSGDVDSFRFMWFRFPHQLSPMNITILPQDRQSLDMLNPTTRKIARMAALDWEGEAIPGGVATNLWAFMSLAGYRIYCVLTENDNDTQKTLHFRGDDRKLLFSFAGSKASRESVVASLLDGTYSVQD